MELRGQHSDILIRSGVKPGTIKTGDEVTVKGYHARDASQNVGAAREIVMSTAVRLPSVRSSGRAADNR